VNELKTKPNVYVSGSAVGFYPTHHLSVLDESFQIPETNFSGELTSLMERTVTENLHSGVRPVIIRTAPVLHPTKGFGQSFGAFEMGVGTQFGDGNQIFPFIHYQDLSRILEFVMTNEDMSGPVNAFSPEMRTNDELTKILQNLFHQRFKWPHIPTEVLNSLLGERSQLLTEGGKVYPTKLVNKKFEFKFAHLETALQNCVQERAHLPREKTSIENELDDILKPFTYTKNLVTSFFSDRKKL